MADWKNHIRNVRCDKDYILSTYNQLTGKMQVDVISFSYAAALAFGGIMGYWKAGSTQSLYSGVILGGFMAFGAYQTSHDPNNVTVSLLTSFGTMALMANRYHNTGKFMPAGIVALISIVMVARFGLRLLSIKTP